MTASRIRAPAARKGQRAGQVARANHDVHKVHAVLLRGMGLGRCTVY